MSNWDKETDNVCNMPQIVYIGIHKSKKTGAYYLNVINYDDRIETEYGLWTDVEITEKEVKEIADIINRNPKH